MEYKTIVVHVDASGGAQARIARGDVRSALLVLASEYKADLLAMGCYGYSRLRDIILGGGSRTVLRRACLPLLIAH